MLFALLMFDMQLDILPSHHVMQNRISQKWVDIQENRRFVWLAEDKLCNITPLFRELLNETIFGATT